MMMKIFPLKCSIFPASFFAQSSLQFGATRLTLILSCSMNFHLYPHDTQQCAMKIESRKFLFFLLSFKYWSIGCCCCCCCKKKGAKKGKNPFRSSGDRIVKKHEHAAVRIKESLKGNKATKLLHFSDPTLLFESLIEPLKSKSSGKRS